MGFALDHRTPNKQINLSEKAISGYKMVGFNLGNIWLLNVNAKV